MVTFVVVGLLISVVFPKEEKRNADALIRIGAGDDVSGILMEETVDELSQSYTIKESLEGNAFQDCWNNIAQWALSAGKINVAFYCSHIAMHTIEENENVMIYGPVIMNAEVICYKEPWEEKKDRDKPGTRIWKVTGSQDLSADRRIPGCFAERNSL